MPPPSPEAIRIFFRLVTVRENMHGPVLKRGQFVGAALEIANLQFTYNEFRYTVFTRAKKYSDQGREGLQFEGKVGEDDGAIFATRSTLGFFGKMFVVVGGGKKE